MPKTLRTAKTGVADGKETSGVRGEEVYRGLYSAIVEHKLLPGSLLPEGQLATAFGVSRTRIREALQRLAGDGLVSIRFNKRATVAKPTRRDTREVFALRRVLESYAIRESAGKISKMDLAALKQLVADEREAAINGDYRDSFRCSTQFHKELARMSGNVALIGTLGNLMSKTALVVAANTTPIAARCRFHDHEKILDLLVCERVNDAAEEMDRHLQYFEENLGVEIDLNDKERFGKIFSKNQPKS